MPGLLLKSGLGVSTVGCVTCAKALDGALHWWSAAGAIVVLGAGAVLALIGVQLFIRAPSAPVSASRLVFSSVARSVLVTVVIGAGIALVFGHGFAFDLVRGAGLALPVIVVIDLAAYLGVLQARSLA